MRWRTLYAVNLLFTIFALMTCWLWPVFAELELGPTDNGNSIAIGPRLPEFLSWLMTPDNSLLGDNGHKARWAGRSRYLQMTAWLFRNPAYGFGITVCGAKITPDMPVTVSGNPHIKNRDNGVAGEYVCTVGPYWNHKRITDNGDGTCSMLETGWKLQDYAKNPQYVSQRNPQIVGWIRKTRFILYDGKKND